ncbi:MAG: prolyl oligopeptidase family serine peptidase [Caldisphaera sp.]
MDSFNNIISIKSISDVQISSNGDYLAYTIADSYRFKGALRPKSSIWIYDFKNKITHNISYNSLYGYMPRWSPDESKLAFLGFSDLNSNPQLYIYDNLTHIIYKFTDILGEILQIEWSENGNMIALLIQDHKEGEQDPIEFEAKPEFSKIWILNIENGELKQISSDYQVWEFSWSPDNKNFIALISDEPYEWAWHIAKIAIINNNSKEPKIVYDPVPRQIGSLKWSMDGKRIFFISATWSDRGLVGGDLYTLDPFKGSKPNNLTNDELGSVHYYNFIGKNQILALSTNNSKTLFSIINTEKNSIKNIINGEFFVDPWYQPKFSFSTKSNIIALVKEDFQNLQEIWFGKFSDDKINFEQLTYINNKTKELFEGDGKFLKWKSFDGIEIQGFIYTSNRSHKKRPLIVNVHGGPSIGYGYRFEPIAKYFVSKGYNVLLPNPRGSMGRGTKFLEMNRENLDGKDFKDIMAGIEYCIENGYADPKNLFIMGGSYGGYLTAWAVTQTNIFNAAVVNYGISDLLSCHGTEWNTYWERFIFDIDPYKNPDDYLKKSPIYYIKNVKTPTLILHGKEDPCVHISQALELFRALKELGIETKLIIYPREKHGWTEKEHIMNAIENQLNWFNSHLKN